MPKKKKDRFISESEYKAQLLALRQESMATLYLAKEIYMGVVECKNKSARDYFKWLSYYYSRYSEDYYNRLFRIYRFFVVEKKINMVDLCDIEINLLYRIASAKKGIFSKYLVEDMLDNLKNFGDVNETRTSFIWKIKNKRISFLDTVEKNQKKYTADVVEEFYRMHEVSKTNTDRIV